MDDIKMNVGSGSDNIKRISLEPKKEEQLKQLSAKLHAEYDKDLIQLMRKVPKRERSKLVRDALRLYFRGTE